MRVIRKSAYQGHAVPQTAMSPRGPFPAEVMASPVITFDNDSDDLLPPGATAQNNYQGLRHVRCTLCGDVMIEDDAPSHTCSEDDDGED